MTRQFIHQYTLPELEQALDHGPVATTENDGSITLILTKRAHTSAASYEIARFHHDTWQYSMWGKTLTEVLLCAVFGAGRVLPGAVDAEAVTLLTEGRQII